MAREHELQGRHSPSGKYKEGRIPRPNFFIMGAPKCGTTSIYQYLSTHPAVFTCRVKEPHYFANDLPARRQVRTEEDYLALFAGAGKQHAAIGEASTWYLFSKEAATRMRDFHAEARLIVCFRNPVDFVQSLHDQFAYDRGESPDFQKAWRQDAARFLEFGSFGGQLKRLQTVFPREQVLVVFLEDLIDDPRGQYRRILHHLGLPDDGRQTFGSYNARKVYWSNQLAQFAKNTPDPLVRLWLGFKTTLGIKEIGILGWLHRRNTKLAPRPKIGLDLREEIRQAFAEDIGLLERLTGRDLSYWA